jgi:hypothetical protein
MNAISIRCLAVRLFIPVSWRISRQRIAASLRRFSQVEADSAWQMLVALDSVTDPEFRAELFNNALEEVHHSYIFRNIARQYEDRLTSEAPEERRQLFDPKQGLVKFEAYHYVGEADVFRDFLSYALASPHADIHETFMAIRGDEEEHQKLAYAELVRQCGSIGAARRLIWKVRLHRAWDAWVRGSKKFGDLLSLSLLMGIYFTLGMLLAPACRNRLRSEGAGEKQAAAVDQVESIEPAVS